MTKKIVAKVGEYQKDGETKNRYQDIGAILENQHGEYMLLNPGISLAGILALQNGMTDRPRTNVMCSIFAQDGGNRAPAPAQPAQKDSFDDELPF